MGTSVPSRYRIGNFSFPSARSAARISGPSRSLQIPMAVPDSRIMMRTPARFRSRRACSTCSESASILGESREGEPSKPTEPGFEGFVGSLSAPFVKIRSFGCQSIHRLRAAIIPTLPDSPHTDPTDAHRTAQTHRKRVVTIRHPEALPQPASRHAANRARSIPSGRLPGR